MQLVKIEILSATSKLQNQSDDEIKTTDITGTMKIKTGMYVLALIVISRGKYYINLVMIYRHVYVLLIITNNDRCVHIYHLL